MVGKKVWQKVGETSSEKREGVSVAMVLRLVHGRAHGQVIEGQERGGGRPRCGDELRRELGAELEGGNTAEYLLICARRKYEIE